MTILSSHDGDAFRSPNGRLGSSTLEPARDAGEATKMALGLRFHAAGDARGLQHPAVNQVVRQTDDSQKTRPACIA
jgi:hypothetical protein